MDAKGEVTALVDETGSGKTMTAGAQLVELRSVQPVDQPK